MFAAEVPSVPPTSTKPLGVVRSNSYDPPLTPISEPPPPPSTCKAPSPPQMKPKPPQAPKPPVFAKSTSLQCGPSEVKVKKLLFINFLPISISMFQKQFEPIKQTAPVMDKSDLLSEIRNPNIKLRKVSIRNFYHIALHL